MASESKNLTVQESKELIEKNQNKKNFIILDVRTPEEFSNGHIKNAVNIDFYSSDFDIQISSLKRDDTYLIYCRSGGRSLRTFLFMKELGFKKIYHLDKGIIYWEKES